MEYKIMSLDYVNECKNESKEVLYKGSKNDLVELIDPANWNKAVYKSMTETEKELSKIEVYLKQMQGGK